MPNPVNTGGIVGTDNISPIIYADRRWQVWNMDEIYLGGVASNKYVPRINDLVFQIVGSVVTRYIVIDVNLSTLVPVLREEDSITHTTNITNDEILFGVGPGTQSDTYRIYIDKSVTPYRLSVDARLMVAGSMCRWCKIFKGSLLTESANVISRMYDASGNLISENVPLELAADVLINNHTIRNVSPCYTNNDLMDGELVTAVFYDDTGYVVSKRQLLVENTAFIKSTDIGTKYIVSIDLKSPFMSPTNVRLIQYPVNVPLASLNLIGLVTYSDGSVVEYPVNGTKFTIYGFENYVATQVGQRIKLVLKYSLSVNEFNYIANIGSEKHISQEYEAITTVPDNSYSVKLYAYPVWIDAVSGYRLEWFMYNLNRNIRYNVTSNVIINPDFGVFDPVKYGVKQRLNVSINIKNVNGVYKKYIHAQTIDITLNKQGTEKLDNWYVGFSPSQSPNYGVETYITAKFINTNNWKVKINSGCLTITEWLDKVYLATQPLFEPNYELRPIVPNYFYIVIGGVKNFYSINNWNSELTVNGSINNNTTIFIEFIYRSSTGDLQLSIAGLPVYHIDSLGHFI